VLVATVLLSSPTLAFVPDATIIVGKVVGIVDGDTLDVLQSNVQYRIRLLDIDSPEKGQAFGKAAKKILSDMVFGKVVKCISTGKDRNQRHLATVYLDGKDVNLSMVLIGYAWSYYTAKNTAYVTAMNSARTAKKGLWADVQPIDPHDWRKLSKTQRDAIRARQK
jgi:micrococcal nuclease